jgi:hypothetical protein
MIGPIAKMAEPIVKVYKIENGFLIETATDLNDVHNYTFAKDASAIAEFVITAAARETLGIPKQQEMFTNAQMGNNKGK